MKTFDLETGELLAGKYRVRKRIGAGWEGEVYLVTETATGIARAAKLFYPERNPRNRTVRFHARKLSKLRECPLLIRYCTQDTVRFGNRSVTVLVSEYAPGELLSDFVKRQRGGRLHPFEALHVLHPLVRGIEQIHAMGEYHGDIHMYNILVRRVGIGFQLTLLDFFDWGKRTQEHVLDDVCGVIQVFHACTGGAKHYAGQPEQVKSICRGLKRSLIRERFRNATRLREYIEQMSW